jgi:hypothetical protein
VDLLPPRAHCTAGYKEAGYEYVSIDDCWQAHERAADGTIQANATRFPSGMKALGDYVHSKGLKFGLYTAMGRTTCQGYPALDCQSVENCTQGRRDAHTLVSWGIDYIKVWLLAGVCSVCKFCTRNCYWPCSGNCPDPAGPVRSTRAVVPTPRTSTPPTRSSAPGSCRRRRLPGGPCSTTLRGSRSPTTPITRSSTACSARWPTCGAHSRTCRLVQSHCQLFSAAFRLMLYSAHSGC